MAIKVTIFLVSILMASVILNLSFPSNQEELAKLTALIEDQQAQMSILSNDTKHLLVKVSEIASRLDKINTSEGGKIRTTDTFLSENEKFETKIDSEQLSNDTQSDALSVQNSFAQLPSSLLLADRELDKFAEILILNKDMTSGAIDRPIGTDDVEITILSGLVRSDLQFALEVLEANPDFGHLEMALVRSLDSEDKQVVLEAYRDNIFLSQLVYEKQWHFDAKDTALGHFFDLERNDIPPNGLLEAVASYQEPQTYDLLRRYYTEGWQQMSLDSIMRRNPDIDYTQWVADMWQFTASSPFIDPMRVIDLSYLAASQGIPDSLVQSAMLLVNQFTNGDIDADTFNYYQERLLGLIETRLDDLSLEDIANSNLRPIWQSQKHLYHLDAN